MITPATDTLSEHYGAVQQRWRVADASDTYSRLVVPNGNADLPFHGWFHLKEAYSASLLSQLFKDTQYTPERAVRIYDPYSGSGTTLLSAMDYSPQVEVSGLGVERNPFLFELSTAKILGRSRGRGLVRELSKTAEDVIAAYSLLASRSPQSIEIPPLATLGNEDYFPRVNVERLIALRNAISEVGSPVCRAVLRVCLAASVEPSGRLRRDGRALRYMPSRIPRDPSSVFAERVAYVLRDLETSDPSSAEVAIKYGDGRTLPAESPGAPFDWIIFSPPYPNNIDYTEVYKTEAWVLGCYSSQEEFRGQRLSTVRSHPSIRFSQDFKYQSSAHKPAVDALIEPVLAAVPNDRYKAGRVELITGYADDMLSTLQTCRELAAPGSTMAFIVGNSAHGSGSESLIIAADVLMAALAELSGWVVREIKIARRLARRKSSSEFLRESVVVLKAV